MGYVYILVNESMPGLIKIGKTACDSRDRARKLSNSTGVPTPFEVTFELFSEGYEELEREMHSRFTKYRVAQNREFFKCPVDDAKRLLVGLHSEHLRYKQRIECQVHEPQEIGETLVLNNHPINQQAKFLLTQVPENPNDFYRIPTMTWTPPLMGPGSKDHLYLFDLMMWYLEHHSSEIVGDAAYLCLSIRDLEIQIEELQNLPPYEAMMWMVIPKGIFTDDELGCGELEDRFLIETDPKTGGWLAIQHLLTIMEAQQIKFQMELGIT